MARQNRDEIENQIVSFIRSYISENGYSPTVREIGTAVGLKSTSTVFSYLKRMTDSNKICMDAEKTRTIKLPETDEFKAEVSQKDETFYVKAPVIGTVAAGSPIFAEQNLVDVFPLPGSFSRKGEIFMLKVKGESMINAGILDGDFVIVSKTPIAREGEIVVAMIDGEATVKRFFKEADGVIRLQPENEMLEPIFSKEVTIIGKVVGVFRDGVI